MYCVVVACFGVVCLVLFVFSVVMHTMYGMVYSMLKSIYNTGLLTCI